MTNRLLLTFWAIFMTTVLYGQQITKEEIRKFKIKSITTIDADGRVQSIDLYDSDGDLVRVDDKGDDGKVYTRKELHFNDQKLITEEVTHTADGRIHRIMKFLYNDKNQLTRKESYNPNKVDGTWTYEYDPEGHKIRETKSSGTMGNSVTVFKYLGMRLIEEETTDDTIGKEERITYKYNKKGQLTRKKSMHFYFNTTITEKYVYDKSGKLVERKERSSNGVSSTTTYQYDDRGLLISDIWKGSLGDTQNRTTYIIEF